MPIAKRFVRLPGGNGTGFERLISLEEEKKALDECSGEYVMQECEAGE